MRRKNSRLEAHLKDAHVEIAQLKSDPAVVIGRSILKEARDSVDSDTDMQSFIDMRIASARALQIERNREAIVNTGIREALEEERLAMLERAELQANVDVQAAREAYKQSDKAAEDYQAELAKLRESYFPAMLAEEQLSLHQRALVDLRDEAVLMAPNTFHDLDPRSDREYSKKRAKEIKKVTDVSRVFDFKYLTHHDELELVFVSKGDGNELLTHDYGGPRNGLVERRLLLRYNDLHVDTPDDDLFEVLKDSKDLIHPLTQVEVYSANPTASDFALHGIVKARPATVAGTSGDEHIGDELELWYANLNEFRILS